MTKKAPLSANMTTLWALILSVTKCLQAVENIWKIWFAAVWGVKARSVELNVSQRCSSAMMSAADLQEAVAAGQFGVRCALKGETGKNGFLCKRQQCSLPYAPRPEDVNLICNKEKTVPLEWISER